MGDIAEAILDGTLCECCGCIHEVLTEITQYLCDKKHINIKYALPVAERIIQMVEISFEECDE